MNTADSIKDGIIVEFKRRVEQESIFRIKKCLTLLDEEEVWYQHNPKVNSVGNLVLHLTGNARQWIISGVGGLPDTRQRDAEFEQKGHKSKAELQAMLEELAHDMNQVLAKITPEQLLDVRAVQVFEETILAILIHVIEHFSYHTGQITYLTKLIKEIDTNYYGDLDLTQKGDKKD